MHTAERLNVDMFDVEVNGTPGTIESVFPGWDRHDRFAIVIHEPYGAVGASLLVQASVAEFFRTRRQAGLEDHYPEIYAFHVGRDFGDLSAYDFWPFRKEVVVRSDPDSVLRAINDRAITRLAVPDGANRSPEFMRHELLAAEDRTRTAVAYSSTGRVDRADIAIRATSPVTEQNTIATFDLLGFTKNFCDSHSPGVQQWIGHVGARLNAVSAQEKARAIGAHEAVLVNGMATETYRTIDVEFAFARLVP